MPDVATIQTNVSQVSVNVLQPDEVRVIEVDNPDVASIETNINQTSVLVTEGDQVSVTVTEPAVSIVEVSISSVPTLVETGVVGPQGPAGGGATALSQLSDVNVVNKVNKSVLVFDTISNKFVANDANTIGTITDGGNF
jgi:hypothetical protein